MNIKIEDIVNNQNLWLNKLKLFQYDIKVLVEKEEHEVTAIYLDKDNSYIAYNTAEGKSVRKDLNEVEEIIVKGDSEEELKKEISRLRIEV